MRKRIVINSLLLLGLLLSPLKAFHVLLAGTPETFGQTYEPKYAYSDAFDRILGDSGKRHRQNLVRAAALFDIPVDILAASVKTESEFRNLAASGTGERTAIGLAQITLYEWLRAGQSEKIRQLGMAKIFTTAHYNSDKGGLHPLFNLICHASALRTLYEQFLQYPLVNKIPFDPTRNPIGWLVALAMYNGGERILSTIYDEKYQAAYKESARWINWEKIQPEDLIRLLRHGRGYHADWSRNSVANHIQKICNNLYTEPPLVKPVTVDIGRRVLIGKTPPPQRIYQTLNPGYNE